MTTAAKPTTRFIVMEASAHVSGAMRKYGRYVHVAVVETDLPEGQPAMISERAKGVVRIVWDSGAVLVGKTDRAADAKARIEALGIAERMSVA